MMSPVRLSLSAALLLCSAVFLVSCSSSPDFEEIDRALHSKIDEWQTESHRLRTRIEEDDAALKKAAQARLLPAADRQALDIFLQERQALVTRYATTVETWKSIDQELHTLQQAPPETERDRALEARLTQLQQETLALNLQFDALREREDSIRKSLEAAPKK